jgi:hypothetical protein
MPPDLEHISNILADILHGFIAITPHFILPRIIERHFDLFIA